jgi:hypothetical protein
MSDDNDDAIESDVILNPQEDSQFISLGKLLRVIVKNCPISDCRGLSRLRPASSLNRSTWSISAVLIPLFYWKPFKLEAWPESRPNERHRKRNRQIVDNLSMPEVRA